MAARTQKQRSNIAKVSQSSACPAPRAGARPARVALVPVWVNGHSERDQ